MSDTTPNTPALSFQNCIGTSDPSLLVSTNSFNFGDNSAIALNNKAIELLGRTCSLSSTASLSTFDDKSFASSNELFKQALERVLSLLQTSNTVNKSISSTPNVWRHLYDDSTENSSSTTQPPTSLSPDLLGIEKFAPIMGNLRNKNDLGNSQCFEDHANSMVFSKAFIVSSKVPDTLFGEAHLAQLGSVILFNTAVLHHIRLLCTSCCGDVGITRYHQVMCLYRQAYELAARSHLYTPCCRSLNRSLVQFVSLAVLNNVGLLYYELGEFTKTSECMEALLKQSLFHSAIQPQQNRWYVDEMRVYIEQFILNAMVLRHTQIVCAAAA